MQCNSPVTSQVFGRPCATNVHHIIAFVLLSICFFDLSTRTEFHQESIL